jgi:hypothetical protein
MLPVYWVEMFPLASFAVTVRFWMDPATKGVPTPESTSWVAAAGKMVMDLVLPVAEPEIWELRVTVPALSAVKLTVYTPEP